MKTDDILIGRWPRVQELPPVGRPLLLRVTASTFRGIARQATRAALRATLASWSGFSPEKLPLTETLAGPVWQGALWDHALSISVSYAQDEAWVALLRGDRIGVDAMSLDTEFEIEPVARHFLSPAQREAIENSADSLQAFAKAWTDLEARSKCLALGLVEWSPTRDAALANCRSLSLTLPGRTVISVAVSQVEVAHSALNPSLSRQNSLLPFAARL